ncbi:MAG: hypothetical protein RL272_39 [Candidatus Parcubacteria bacterium]
MGEAERRLPPPLPAKKKPKLIEDMVGEAPGEEIELTDADIAPAEDGEELFEIDVDTSDLSPDLIAGAEAREKKRLEAEPLREFLAGRGLNDEASLEIIAAYDPALLKDEAFSAEMSDVAAAFGVRFDRMGKAEREKLAVMYLGAKNGRIDKNRAEIAEALEGGIRDQLVGQAFADIGAIRTGLEQEKADPEKLKGNLREAMATLNALSKQLPFDKPENEAVWARIYEQFDGFRLARKTEAKAGTDAARAFSEIFEEFSGFIDDDIIAYRLARSPGASIEHVTQDTYGRSKEEVEAMKQANRQAVVEAMGRMTEEPGITPEMLEELHALNNRGVVPKKFSRLRDNPNEIVTFGKRIGLLGSDVRPQVDEMIDRANDLIDRNAVHGMTSLRYEVEAAKLHNDLLDMHPFGDRNGSTSMLFLELLMIRKGYEPSPERQKDYYKHLGNVLGYNPVAMAVVGYEQYKISRTPGYYEGPGMTEEKKQEYGKVMGLIERMKQRRQGFKKQG